MQLKKPTDRPVSNEYSSSQSKSQFAEDAARKKIIVIGIGLGAIGAAAVGTWIWLYGPNLPTKLINTKQPTPPHGILKEDHPSLQNEAKKNIPVVTLPEFRKAENSPIVGNQNTELSAKALIDESMDTPKKEESTPDDIVLNNSPTESKKIFKKVHKKVKKLPMPKPEAIINSEIYQYNALTGGPVIKASAGNKIEVSRNIYFKGIYVSGIADDAGEFRITNPPPGNVYWRIKGNAGANKIKISSPDSTNLDLKLPEILNLGDSFSWTGNENVAYYKIEVSNERDFINQVRTFSTKETSLNTTLIGQGSWFIRLAAMNLKSGTFDYSRINSLAIQGPSQFGGGEPRDTTGLGQRSGDKMPETPPASSQIVPVDTSPADIQAAPADTAPASAPAAVAAPTDTAPASAPAAVAAPADTAPASAPAAVAAPADTARASAPAAVAAPADTAPASAPAAPVDTSAIQMPDTSAIQMPDTSAIQMPDTSAIQAPDTSAIQMPDTSAIQMPDTSAIQAPDSSALKMPELPSTDAPAAAAQ